MKILISETTVTSCLLLPFLIDLANAGNVSVVRRVDAGHIAVTVDASGATSAAVPASDEGQIVAATQKSLAPSADVDRHIHVMVDALGVPSAMGTSSVSSHDDFAASHTSIIRQGNRMGARHDNLLELVHDPGLSLLAATMPSGQDNKLGHYVDPNVSRSGGLALTRIPNYFGDVVQHLAKVEMGFAAPIVPNGRPLGLQLLLRSIIMYVVCFAWVAGGLFIVGFWLRSVFTSSPVLFYSDAVVKESEKPEKQYLRTVCETKECEAFLESFNTIPRKVQLRISGRRSVDKQGVVGFFWHFRRGNTADVFFTAHLDLKLFVSAGSICKEELAAVRAFIETKNPLAVLSIRKNLKWDGLHEVTQNIRDRLHELGFSGVVDVGLEGNDRLLVRHNHEWTNFIHSPATWVLACCSVLGGFLLMPYMWARTRRTSIESTFRVNVHPKDYWDLVGVGIDAHHGFVLR